MAEAGRPSEGCFLWWNQEVTRGLVIKVESQDGASCLEGGPRTAWERGQFGGAWGPGPLLKSGIPLEKHSGGEEMEGLGVSAVCWGICGATPWSEPVDHPCVLLSSVCIPFFWDLHIQPLIFDYPKLLLIFSVLSQSVSQSTQNSLT